MKSKFPLIHELLPIVHFEAVQVAHLRGHAQVAEYLRKLTTKELLLKQRFVHIGMLWLTPLKSILFRNIFIEEGDLIAQLIMQE